MKLTAKANTRSGPRKRPLTLLTIEEEKRLRGEIAGETRYLNAVHGRIRVSDDDNSDAHLSPGHIKDIDTSAIEVRIKRRQRALDAMSPQAHKFIGAKRQSACKEMREHEDFFRKHMLTSREMGRYPKGDDHELQQEYMRACEKSIAMEVGNSEFQRRAHRYKELARRLDPDNADLPNLERFRPVVRTGGRIRRY
ncbi:MAG: hypothetical protein QME60_01310 [Verrucomicrobiota bacterium]|nr:hypothetical protein [Verrucomicrobiota bacterium]